MEIVVSNISVEVIRKNIKNMHLAVLPPDGRVRVSAPTQLTDEAITMFVRTKLGWIKNNRRSFNSSRAKVSGSMCPGKHYMFGVSSTFFKWNTATKAMLSHFRVTRLF